MTSGKNDQPGFVTPVAVSGLGSSGSSWACSRSPHLRLARSPVGARAPPMKTLLCAAAPPSKEEEEDVLDEKAMRAAEIHEVLTGLEDFKARIIDDATKLAKKVRASKKDLKRSLEVNPDILKIDGHLKDLKEELKQLGDR